MSPGFSRLATAFFNGEMIDDRFDDFPVRSNTLEDSTAKFSVTFVGDDLDGSEAAMLGEAGPAQNVSDPKTTINSNHVIVYQKSAWVELLDQIQIEGQLQGSNDPLKTTSHKVLGLFLQDVIMANAFEDACVKGTRVVSISWFLISLLDSI